MTPRTCKGFSVWLYNLTHQVKWGRQNTRTPFQLWLEKREARKKMSKGFASIKYTNPHGVLVGYCVEAETQNQANKELLQHLPQMIEEMNKIKNSNTKD
jgi:hypothetical protein